MGLFDFFKKKKTSAANYAANADRHDLKSSIAK